jgi:hypothetical protein
MSADDRRAIASTAPPPSSGARRVLLGGTALGGAAAAGVAAFASLCCVGPLTVAVLGAGGAVAAASLARYRLPLLIVSLTFIAVGYWRTYRRLAPTGTRACPVSAGRWLRRGLAVAALLWTLAAVLFFLQ